MTYNKLLEKLEMAAEKGWWVSVLVNSKRYPDFFQGSVKKTEGGYIISGYDEELVFNNANKIMSIKKLYIYGESEA